MSSRTRVRGRGRRERDVDGRETGKQTVTLVREDAILELFKPPSCRGANMASPGGAPVRRAVSRWTTAHCPTCAAISRSGNLTEPWNRMESWCISDAVFWLMYSDSRSINPVEWKRSYSIWQYAARSMPWSAKPKSDFSAFLRCTGIWRYNQNYAVK